jgi:hypothetical protein
MNAQMAFFALATAVALNSAHAEGVLLVDTNPIAEARCAEVKKRHARALKLWDELGNRSEALHSRITALEDKPKWLRSILSHGIRAEVDRINRRVEELKALETTDALRRDFLQEMEWVLQPETGMAGWDEHRQVLSRSGELESVALVNGAWVWGEARPVLEASGFEDIDGALAEFRNTGTLRLRRKASLVEICLGKVVFQAEAAVTVKWRGERGEQTQEFRVQLRQRVDLRNR